MPETSFENDLCEINPHIKYSLSSSTESLMFLLLRIALLFTVHTLPALSPSTILSFLTHWWFLNQIISFDSLTSSLVVFNALCLSYCRLLLWESLNLFRKTKSWKITSSVKYNSQADYSCRHMILSVTILIEYNWTRSERIKRDYLI